MTSSRRGEPWYTQLRSWSLAVKRSIVLFTPKGLPQRMQQNGSSSLSTRAAAASGVKSSWGLRVMTFSGQVDLHSPKIGVPVQWWRSVGHSHTGFSVEAFLDEVAHAGGKDPYELRRKLLANQPRMLAVLDLAAQKANWGAKLPPGVGRGIAGHFSFDSYVAQVVEASVGKDGAVRVHRVVCAVDCGIVINPDTVKAQMEGGIVFGLTAALKTEITLKNGRVEQTNFHDYQMLRIFESPKIEVYIVPSSANPTGVGEPGVPPVAPALANAIFAVTGKRIRRLPIRASDLAENGAKS